jgi:Dyp-type peroxidase family
MAEALVTDGAPESVEWGEVQRLVLRGYTNLPWAHFLLLRVERRKDAARWLRRLLDEQWIRFGWGDKGDKGPVGSVAFTRDGLEAFGLSSDTIRGFSPEFIEGMVTSARSRILRDLGTSAPENWLWGGPTNPVHLVLGLHAGSDAAIDAAVRAQKERLAEAGLVEVRGLDASALGSCRPLEDRREHFGFADGIGQPRFRDEPVAVRSRKTRDADRIATGELLLGYRNEAGLLPRSPVLAPADSERARFSRRDRDFGKNGSYLVFRQLEQDVGAFWRAMADGERGATVEDRVHLASKMVGRWPDGAPLVTRPTPDTRTPEDPEDFDFAHDDPNGARCPFGAHIRRANPRATLARDPGMGLEKSKKHRILRRGRSYGEPFVKPLVPEELVRAAESGTGAPGPRGLHFLCFNADIANQFEFVQQTWVNGPMFMGLHGEVDPMIGDPSDTGGLFTMPGEPFRRRVHGLPRFVEVRGGAYFFTPSQAALHYLARLD